RGLPVDRELRSPLRLPVLSSGLLCMHAVTTTPAATDGTCFARAFHRLRPSPTVGRVGSCIGCFGACSVFTLHYGLHDSPSRLKATLYFRGSGSFVASAAAPIATGWSESVPGRDFQPAVDHLLYTAHQHPLARNGVCWTVGMVIVGFCFDSGGRRFGHCKCDSHRALVLRLSGSGSGSR